MTAISTIIPFEPLSIDGWTVTCDDVLHLHFHFHFSDWIADEAVTIVFRQSLNLCFSTNNDYRSFTYLFHIKYTASGRLPSSHTAVDRGHHFSSSAGLNSDRDGLPARYVEHVRIASSVVSHHCALRWQKGDPGTLVLYYVLRTTVQELP